ncbi:MAG TPA: hypothetical protein VJ992_09385 [Gemmatimonadales bacterium]|nr:hypothetical protein [Gemmatimonadales bacterium]
MSPRLLVLIPLAVGINLAMGQFASAISLPVYLDTVGTILVAALTGLVPALITGLLSQVVTTVVSGNSIWIAFLPVQLYVAAFAAVAARAGAFRGIWRTVGTGLLLGATAALLSWPIAYLAFGGVTATGVTAVTTVLTAIGFPLRWAVLAASASTDLLDKTATVLLVRGLLVALPRRTAARFPLAERALGRA